MWDWKHTPLIPTLWKAEARRSLAYIVRLYLKTKPLQVEAENKTAKLTGIEIKTNVDLVLKHVNIKIDIYLELYSIAYFCSVTYKNKMATELVKDVS